MTHLAKDCMDDRRRVALEDKMQMVQDKYCSDYDDNKGSDATARCAMLIFGGPRPIKIGDSRR